MRFAFISDIHSNLEALERSLEKIDAMGVDHILCLGDIVGYGPYPNECVQLVRNRCTMSVQGNHDSGVTGETSIGKFTRFGQSAIQWTQEVLLAEHVEYLRSLPLVHTVADVTIVHSSPRRPHSWEYVFSWPDAQRCFANFSTGYCFLGHTHIPFVVSENGVFHSFSVGIRHLINVGSIGQARDGIPKASFGVLDTAKGSYENVRVEYDIERTVKAIHKANLPEYLGQRLFLGI